MKKEFLFSDGKLATHSKTSKNTSIKENATNEKWKILIVDDDPEVHDVTKLTLSKLRFKNRKLFFLDAYNIEETKTVLAQHPDTAVIFLDVVMETEHAGLDLVRYIREDIQIYSTRIILRTGQPGQAPEEDVILNYDINDYKAKTDLTSQKLRTTTISALRGYKDIIALENNRRGLSMILESSESLFHLNSMQQFSSAVLMKLSSFLQIRPNGLICTQETPSNACPSEDLSIVAATGEFTYKAGTKVSEILHDRQDLETLLEAKQQRTSLFREDHTALYIPIEQGRDVYAFLKGYIPPTTLNKQLLQVFCSKISVGFENIRLYEALRQNNLDLEKRVEERTEELQKANQELKRMATTDALTGAANRRYLMDAGQKEIERSKRYGHIFSVLIFDIDYFKKINDQYGHLLGDEALKKLVIETQAQLREEDLLGRYGGEEFVVLLPETDSGTAYHAAERLRKIVENISVSHEKGEFSFTISLGVASLTDDIFTLLDLLNLADQALYTAKEQGRNRTILYSDIDLTSD